MFAWTDESFKLHRLIWRRKLGKFTEICSVEVLKRNQSKLFTLICSHVYFVCLVYIHPPAVNVEVICCSSGCLVGETELSIYLVNKVELYSKPCLSRNQLLFSFFFWYFVFLLINRKTTTTIIDPKLLYEEKGKCASKENDTNKCTFQAHCSLGVIIRQRQCNCVLWTSLW